MKNSPPERYHRTDSSLTLHVMSCFYQLHVLILKTCGLSCNCRYESYEEAHGRMALRPLMMSQTATPHKLLNDLLCKFSIVGMLFFL